MSEPIVVGTDGSDTAKRAVNEAARLAQALGGELHLVSAFEPARGARISGAYSEAAEISPPSRDADVDTRLQEEVVRLRSAGVAVTCHPCQQEPADALIDVADQVGAQMIVVGSRGMHGARRYVLGSVPNTVSHRARCNVLIVSTDGAADRA